MRTIAAVALPAIKLLLLPLRLPSRQQTLLPFGHALQHLEFNIQGCSSSSRQHHSHQQRRRLLLLLLLRLLLLLLLLLLELLLLLLLWLILLLLV